MLTANYVVKLLQEHGLRVRPNTTVNISIPYKYLKNLSSTEFIEYYIAPGLKTIVATFKQQNLTITDEDILVTITTLDDGGLAVNMEYLPQSEGEDA